MRLGIGNYIGGLLNSIQEILFDVFVSYTDGNDTNPGTQLLPLKTITASIATGKNKIGLKPGDTWNEYVQSNVFNRSGISIKPYAAGFATIDSLLTLTGWTKTAGYTNIYECTFTAINQATEGGSVSTVFAFNLDTIAELPYTSISHINRATSLANCDATENSHWTLSKTTSIDKIYVHVAGGVDPSTLNYIYKIACKNKQFDVPYGGVVTDFENITLMPYLNSSPSTLGNCVAKNLFAPCNNDWHYFISEGGDHEGHVICNSSASEDIAYVNYQSFGGYDLGYRHGLFLDIKNGMYAHTGGGSYVIGKQYIYNNFMWSKDGAGYAINNANNIADKNNVHRGFFSNGFKWGYYGLANCDIQDCVFDNCVEYPIFPKNNGTLRGYYKNNILVGAKGIVSSASGLVYYDIENCICHLKTSLDSTLICFLKNTGSINKSIVLIDAPNNSGTNRLYPTGAYSSTAEAIADTNLIDNCVYILCSGLASNIRWGYLTWSSFTTWKTNTGHDTNSVFIDISAKGGFNYLFNADYSMKDVPERVQILAVGAGNTKTFRGFPIKPTYEEAHQMQIDGTLDYYTRDLFI
jgi:hypothetical protein